MKGFTKSETEFLLREVLSAAKSGKSLSSVFSEVSKKTGKAKGSVRNYYYNLLKDENRLEELSKDVAGAEKLKACPARSFSEEDEAFLLSSIDNGKKSGKSVRKIIMELSDGDDKLALRYQNKYRNYLHKIEREKFLKTPVSAEDFKYFDKLSKEIDGLVEKIKDKYAKECLKLKKENDELSRRIKMLKQQSLQGVIPLYFENKNIDFK